MSEEYLREMRKLELQEKDLTSQYNNVQLKDPNDYKNVTNANVTYSPYKGEKWAEYAMRIAIYADINAKKNRLTHIDSPRKSWWTHRNPAGCFMCEDTNLISMLVRVITQMGGVSPDNRF